MMKPFTLVWWLEIKDIAKDRWIEVDDVTDECAMNGSGGYSEEMCSIWWGQWHRYIELERWITHRIINKYGE